MKNLPAWDQKLIQLEKAVPRSAPGVLEFVEPINFLNVEVESMEKTKAVYDEDKWPLSNQPEP